MAISEQKKINQKFLFFSIFGRKTKINVKQMKAQKLASKKMLLMLNNSIILITTINRCYLVNTTF